MDVSKLQQIVDRHLPPLRDLFCLNHWGICPVYEHLDGSTAAQCWPNPDYETARIIFDATKFEDEEQVINLIVHEFGHILEAPFDVFADAVAEIMKANVEASAALHRMFIHASEAHVLGIERIWRGTLARVYLEQATNPGAR